MVMVAIIDLDDLYWTQKRVAYNASGKSFAPIAPNPSAKTFPSCLPLGLWKQTVMGVYFVGEVSSGEVE
jgi:hypothetical protein